MTYGPIVIVIGLSLLYGPFWSAHIMTYVLCIIVRRNKDVCLCVQVDNRYESPYVYLDYLETRIRCSNSHIGVTLFRSSYTPGCEKILMSPCAIHTYIMSMGGASWVSGGSCPLCPMPCLRLPPSRREKKIICALSTLPVHCRSVKFI